MAEEMPRASELQTERNVAPACHREKRVMRHDGSLRVGANPGTGAAISAASSGSSKFIQDLRYGGRMLRRNPGFTSVIALTLALGIGINTLVFHFLRAVFETARRSGARRGGSGSSPWIAIAKTILRL